MGLHGSFASSSHSQSAHLVAELLHRDVLLEAARERPRQRCKEFEFALT
jgi:hypothetical protein